MASVSEVGISPVLLQAITHTLSSNSISPKLENGRDSKQHARNGVVDDGMGDAKDRPVLLKKFKVGGLLHDMNEPVHGLDDGVHNMVAHTLPSGETIIIVQPGNENDESPSIARMKMGSLEHNTSPRCVIKDTLASSMPPLNNSAKQNCSYDLNMGQVLMAIASHLKTSQDGDGGVIDSVRESLTCDATPRYSSAPVIATADACCVNSPVNFSEIENDVPDVIVQTSMPESSHEVTTMNLEQPWTKKQRLDRVDGGEDDGVYMVAPGTFGNVPVGKVVHVMHGRDGEQMYKMVSIEDLLEPPHGFMPCPVCGDRVSGYHYGIYSCESCKGFFKRTVQNKKVFVCHRHSECNINVANRKKCPACRFKQCLMKGMKLEAIRGDRTRGGRSSYDGCTPNRRNVKTVQRRPELPVEVISSSSSSQPTVISQQSPIAASPGQVAPPTAHVVTILTVDNSGTVVDVEQSARLNAITHLQPQTPQLLEDLMAVESLMHDSEGEEACCEGKLSEGDDNVFASLLHVADHCLYKIVRWARNLPHFGNVSTDDQILLLQNCWAELLCLCTSWHSTRAHDELRLLHGKTLSVGRAQATGLADIVARMLDFTEHLRRLEVDCYEYVALKVLMLLSPDVKNLQDELLVRQHQDHVTEALMVYTSTHYPQKANKFCEMLVRLTELSRTCVLGKEVLNQRHSSGDISPHSLLSELLKGDIVVQ